MSTPFDRFDRPNQFDDQFDGQFDGQSDDQSDGQANGHPESLDRRRFLRGAAAGAVAVGLSLSTRRWVARAEPGPDLAEVPPLDGSLVIDPEVLDAAADDFGHIVSHRPWAVLLPGSIEDIERMVEFANRYRVPIAGRNAYDDAHSCLGQSQVEAGIVINNRSLAAVPAVTAADDEIWVEAGARWRDILTAAFPAGKSPPIFPDYVDLSVGGALSVGGIGGQSHQAGFLVDNVSALEVITGEGKREICSPTRNPRLFSSVLGGLGQFAVIARACIRLRDVPPMVRVYSAVYDDVDAFTGDQLVLIRERRFDYVEGFAELDGTTWRYRLEAGAYFAPGAEPDDAALVAGLRFTPGTLTTTDTSYPGFVQRLDPTVDFLRQIGVWEFPHPWLNLFIPAQAAPRFIESTLAATAPEDLGQGPVLIYPIPRAAVRGPYPVLPAGDEVFLFALLRTAVPPTPEQVQDLLAKNRAVFESARDCGGTFYPVNALPLDPADWRRHFGRGRGRGRGWGRFRSAKAQFDPGSVLTPGQKIFPGR
ncbi:FAD-binding protein [Haliangium sp.]|uniref:FAD-binding protein n=1 Tax=Haliangium sp. TaxID=2663208 RepID=UPI003D09AAD4